MTDTKENKSTFAEKYGLQGKGQPVRIAPGARLLVELIVLEGERALAAGEMQRLNDKTRYHVPQP